MNIIMKNSRNFIIHKLLPIIFIYITILFIKLSFINQRSTTSNSFTVVAQRCLESRLRTRRCVSLSHCPEIVEQYYAGTQSQAITVDFQTYISESICGFDGQNFLICCNTTPNSRPSRFVTTTAQPNFGLSLGSLFQFAPLTALNSGSGIFFGSQPPPVVYPSSNPSPVIFQPTTSGPPVMVLPTPNTQPTNNPTPIVLNPVPNTPNSSIQTPIGSRECGVFRGTTNRVVGGAEARRDSYPWIAALGYLDELDRNNLKFQCAGSLITHRHVLTSAHCVTPSLAVVRLGAHDLSMPLEPDAVDLRIRRTITHEAFDIRSIANDISLLELNSPAPMTNTIGTICLPDGANFLTQDFVGSHPFVAGWGAVKHQGPTSNVLRDAQVPIVNRKTCESSYKTVFRFIEFSDKLICAGNSIVDACQGDSGGPLMLPTQVNGGAYRYFLLGIVSYGYECARTGFPGVYTRVASYLPWIRANAV